MPTLNALAATSFELGAVYSIPWPSVVDADALDLHTISLSSTTLICIANDIVN